MTHKICHISTVHQVNDIRIYRKEMVSLSKSFEVFYINANRGDITNLKNIKLVSFEKSVSRIKRILVDNFKAYRKAVKLDCDLYHFHDIEFIFYAFLLKVKGKKVIYDVHEDLPRAILSKKWVPTVWRTPLSAIIEKIENKISSYFDFIITATPHIKKRFKKVNGNTEVINNYPLLDELFTEGAPAKKFNQIAYVGGLGKIRGVEQMAKASLLTHHEIKIAGQVMGLPEENNLKLLGNLDREDVKQLLNESRAGLVVFLPEPNHINAKPNKMFEYMSAALPIICSDFEEWKELIKENKNGITVDPKNPQAIADAIDYLIENPLIAEEMGENGRKAVKENFNWENESVKLKKIYETILKEN